MTSKLVLFTRKITDDGECEHYTDPELWTLRNKFYSKLKVVEENK